MRSRVGATVRLVVPCDRRCRDARIIRTALSEGIAISWSAVTVVVARMTGDVASIGSLRDTDT
ncbi:hypothetical protein CKO23_01285 [Thiocystis violacea]|nr:hypothetical protein [Thiocystis violacea]